MVTNHSSIIEQIKAIPFQAVFESFWIQTYNVGSNTLGIIYEWQKTDGYRLNTAKNFVNDFSGKERPRWDVISFLKQILNQDFSEVLEYCKSNFSITYHEKPEPSYSYQSNTPMNTNILTKNKSSTPETTTKQLKSVKHLWESFNAEFDTAQIDYIESRGIEFEKVKDIIRNNHGKIAMSIQNERGEIINIQSRTIDVDSKNRFELISGMPSKGLFYDKIDREKKEIIVVEWLFDFLSLRQYDTNVVGIVSATSGLEKITAFHNKWYTITFVPDTDKAGQGVVKKIKELLPEFYLMDLACNGCKDINEYLIKSGAKNEIINHIQDMREHIKSDTYRPEIQRPNLSIQEVKFQQHFKHIWYEESLKKGHNELLATNINNVISWGWEEFDQKLWYLIGGRLYLIGGSTWTWKSTFLNQVAYNVAKQGFRVVRYSLEDRLEERRKEELYYMIWRIRKEQGLNNYPFHEFEANHISSSSFPEELAEAVKRLNSSYSNIIDLEKDKRIKIEDLAKLIEEEVNNGCKLFIIDHLHYFNLSSDGTDKWRRDLIIEDVMQQINEIARQYNIIIMIIAHYRKLEKNSRPTVNDFKDSIAIAQICNKIIHIYRDMGTNENNEGSGTEFIVEKSRGPLAECTIYASFNRSTFEYEFLPSTLQAQREWKKIELDF